MFFLELAQMHSTLAATGHSCINRTDKSFMTRSGGRGGVGSDLVTDVSRLTLVCATPDHVICFWLYKCDCMYYVHMCV